MVSPGFFQFHCNHVLFQFNDHRLCAWLLCVYLTNSDPVFAEVSAEVNEFSKQSFSMELFLL